MNDLQKTITSLQAQKIHFRKKYEEEKEKHDKLKIDLLTSIAKKKAWRKKAIDPETKKSYKELYTTLKNTDSS